MTRPFTPFTLRQHRKFFLRCIAAIGCCLLLTVQSDAQYCEPVVNNCDEHITSVELGGTVNTSGCTTGGYIDYSGSVSFNVAAGTCDNIIVNFEPFYNTDGVTVFVDWNNDFDFTDPGEMLFTEIPATGLVIGNVNVSDATAPGNYRMRVRLYYNDGYTDPCFDSNYGEVEDYTLTVGPSTATCAGVGAIATQNISLTGATALWNASASAVSYNVQYSIMDSSNWTTISVPAQDTFFVLTGLDTCTQYLVQVQAVCASDTSAYSCAYDFNTACCIDAAAVANHLEAEACGDETNDGCNMTVPAFENIVCGDSIAGTGWWDGNERDTDWFLFTVTQDTNVNVTLTAAFTSTLQIANASAGCPLDVVDYVVNSVGQCETITINANLAAGTYWIIPLAQFDFSNTFPCGSGKNNYLLTVSCGAPAPAPVNDDCGGAITLLQDTVCNYQTFSNLYSTPSSQTPCAGTANDDVWFSFVATTTNPLVSVIGVPGFDAVFQVLDGCNGATLECIDNSFDGEEESVQLSGLTIGNTYFIRVYDYYSSFPGGTSFDICVSTVFEYCQPSVEFCDEFISNVEMNATTNPTGCTTGGYADYSNDVTYTVQAGTCQTMIVSVGPPFYSGDNLAVFVDWDNNIDFAGSNETLYAAVLEDSVAVISIGIPGNVAPGNYRMRVRLNYFGDLGDPCADSDYGEVEDYTLTVTAGGSCAGPGAVSTNGVPSFTSASFNWGTSATAVSYNVRFKRESDPDNVSSWANPISVTDTFITLSGLDSCTAYEFEVQSVCASDTSSYTCTFAFHTACCIDAAITANHVEAESCGDETNDGCEMDVPAYEPVACGDSVAGTAWYDGNNRDTDWFVMHLDQDTNIVLNLTAAFPSVLFVLDSSQGCFSNPALITESNGPCETVSINTNLVAGTYWVFVAPQFSFATYPCGSGQNNYLLTVDCMTPAAGPVNDTCGGAIAVACGDTVTGSTQFAFADAGLDFCGTEPQAAGVWYSITGDGSVITASLCNGTGYDSKLNVYSGSCDALACVVGNDDACDTQSEVSFLGEVGTQYFIYVNGYIGSIGDFTVAISCATLPTNDSCQNAIAVSCGDTITGTTVGVTIDTEAPDCNFTIADAPGVWYQLTGDGNLVTVSLCNGTNYDSQLGIYTGSCGNFTCVTANDQFCGNQSQVMFPTIQDSVYYILVNGWNGNVGPFTMTISCDTPLVNDAVCGALPVAIGTNGPYNLITATTEPGEPAPPAGDCITTWCNDEITNTLWFTFTAPATGNVTVNSPGFDTQLAVWDADSCQAITNGTATLVGANDDDEDFVLHGGAEYSSYLGLTCLTPGKTYFIQLDVYSPGNPETVTTLVLTDPGPSSADAGFTGLDASYCVSAAPVTLVPNTPGGTFSGPGVNNDEFDPAAAGLGGPYDIVYQLNACTADTQLTVVTQLGITATLIQPDCGSDNGSIDVTANGVSPFSYNWSNASADEDLFNLASGTYTVTVVDASGCSGSESFVLQSAGPLLVADVVDVDGCSGGSNGSISLSIVGTGPFTVLWSNQATTDTLTDLVAGAYDVTVTDASGCSTTNTFLVSETAPFEVMFTVDNQINCPNDNDGAITAMPMSGTPPFTFLWSTNATDASVTGLTSGTYNVTVTDASGCTVAAEYTNGSLSAPILISETHVNAGCGLPGSVDLTVAGGLAPYSFVWTSGETDQNISGLTPGTYTVTVTDANFCSASLTVDIVGGPGNLGLTLTPVGPLTSCYMSYSVTLVANDIQNAIYIFTRDMNTPNGAWVQYNDGPAFSPNTVGSHVYAVIAVDTTSGCVDTSNEVTVNLEALGEIIVTTAPCINNSIEMTATPASPTYLYQWLKNGIEVAGANVSTYTATEPGVYRARVTDSCGVSRVSEGVSFDAACFTGFEGIAMNSEGAGMRIYPNPSDGHFVVETYVQNGGNADVRLQVINMLGQVIHEQVAQLSDGYAKAEIDHVSGIATGVYSVRLTSVSGSVAGTLIVTTP